MSKYEEIPMAKIKEPERIARTEIDQRGIAELADSIRAVGLINPITVKPLGEDYEIVAGHRRYLAHRLIGKPTITARIHEGDDLEAEEVKTIENMQRQNLSFAEEAQGIRYLRDVKDLDLSQIAKTVGKSQSWVRQRLEALTWPTSLLQAVSEKRIPIGAAHHLVKIDDEEYREFLIQQAAKNGISEWVAMGWLQAWETSRTQTPPDEIDVPEKQEQHPVEYKVVIPCFACHEEHKVEDLVIVRLCKRCYRALQDVAD